MARLRKPLAIFCEDSDCANGLHCFKATQAMVMENRQGVCRECGVDLIDWPRVHRRAVQDIENTFELLQREYVRHTFWHKPLSNRAINHARRKGKAGLRPCVRSHLQKAVGPAAPFRDGSQTTMNEEAGRAIPFGQHATAACCRKCIEYWHGIPQGRALTDAELDYLTELVCRYIEKRVPTLTNDGERIPPVRRRTVTK